MLHLADHHMGQATAPDFLFQFALKQRNDILWMKDIYVKYVDI